MLASVGSLVLHVGVVVLAAAVVGKHAAHHSPEPRATDVEIVAPAPRPAAPPRPPPLPPPPGRAMPAPRPAGGVPSAGARARREPVQRTPPSSPANLRSLADLKIDRDPGNFVDPEAAAKANTSSGLGHVGLGAGVDFRQGDGVAGMDIAQPATASLARPARKKHDRDYASSRIAGASRFAGEKIMLRLHLDASGRVQAVDLLQGVDRNLDRKTISLVHSFEFDPALDDSGAPVPATVRWSFDIVEDEDAIPFDSAREKTRR
jgi:TonB family protein